MKIGRVTSVYIKNTYPFIRLDVHTPTGDYNEIQFVVDNPNEWFSPSEGRIVEIHKAEGEYNIARSPRRSADVTLPSGFTKGDYVLSVDGDITFDGDLIAVTDTSLRLGSGSNIESQNGNQLVANTRGNSLSSKDTSTVDSTYGTAEAGVIQNNRTRIDELEQRLQSHGLIN